MTKIPKDLKRQLTGTLGNMVYHSFLSCTEYTTVCI